jgi:hypothetical protein
VELAADVGRGMFAESIRLAQQGKYSEAAGTLVGQNVDMLFGAGIVGDGRKLRAAVEAAEDAGTAARTSAEAARAAEAGARAADAASDNAKVRRGVSGGLLAIVLILAVVTLRVYHDPWEQTLAERFGYHLAQALLPALVALWAHSHHLRRMLSHARDTIRARRRRTVWSVRHSLRTGRGSLRSIPAPCFAASGRTRRLLL